MTLSGRADGGQTGGPRRRASALEHATSPMTATPYSASCLFISDVPIYSDFSQIGNAETQLQSCFGYKQLKKIRIFQDFLHVMS